MRTTNYKSCRGRLADGRPNPVDIHIGNRIRQRRQLLGFSQEKLAELLGLTFQQVQKYEHGTNRVGGSESIELVRNYYKIRNRKLADHLFTMLKELAKNNYGETDE